MLAELPMSRDDGAYCAKQNIRARHGIWVEVGDGTNAPDVKRWKGSRQGHCEKDGLVLYEVQSVFVRLGVALQSEVSSGMQDIGVSGRKDRRRGIGCSPIRGEDAWFSYVGVLLVQTELLSRT